MFNGFYYEQSLLLTYVKLWQMEMFQKKKA